jgi:hypothetical protein
MQKWEYKKISRVMDYTHKDPLAIAPVGEPVYKWQDYPDDDENLRKMAEMDRLEELGKNGWELVSVIYRQEGKKIIYAYYLKRPIDGA